MLKKEEKKTIIGENQNSLEYQKTHTVFQKNGSGLKYYDYSGENNYISY